MQTTMFRIHHLIICLAGALALSPDAQAQRVLAIENSAYRIEVPVSIRGRSGIEVERLDAGGSGAGSREGVSRRKQILLPELTVLYREDDPGYRRGTLEEGNTPVAGWNTAGGRLVNFFKAGRQYTLRAQRASKVSDQEIVFSFPGSGPFTASLSVSLAEGSAAPKFSWELVSGAAGWISAGFTGIPAQDPGKLDFLYQPLVWSWKRFPAEAVLTPEAFSTTAAVFTNSENRTEGLAADPALIPYRFATFENSVFGLVLRTAESQARPMLFAPVLGGEGSFMQPGERSAFSCYYFLEEGDWEAGVKYLYRDLLHYRTERKNATVSLNQTLENMIGYAMDDVYSGWVEELKAYDYRFDVPGTVKNVSALHPLSIALTTDNAEIYRRRALPMMEYMLSREKYLYAVSDQIEKQNPSHYLKGPCMEIGEMASLHQMTGGGNEVFEKEIERLFGKPRQLNLVTETGGASWQDYLARYRISGNPSDLEEAVRLADNYLETLVYRYPADFTTSAGLKDRQASFVTDYTSRWYDLLELYEETGDTRYLKAAESGARQMLLWMRSNPMAPDSVITVNEGGVVPGVFPGRRFKPDSYEFKEYDTSTEIQEQQVEAWRTSLVGLPPEAPSTYRYGPVMLTHHAAWMLRLARHTGDEIFKDAAYNAVVGRYANFPGYYFTSLHTTVYQQPDYPLHPYLDVKYNAIFYNHIWPHIALLQDFLVSDAFLKSGGRVNFPSAYSPGYAFLTSKVYGHLPGEVYGNKGVYLWLPKGGVKADPRLNYVLGRSATDTYLVLLNTDSQDIETTVYLNQDIIPWDSGKSYELVTYGKDGSAAVSAFSNGKLEVKVPGGSLTALKIAGLRCEPTLQSFLPARAGAGAPEAATGTPEPARRASRETTDARAYFREELSGAGTITGMLLSISDKFTDTYLYTDATEKEFRKVSLKYQINAQEWQTLEDESYPYEFSLQSAGPELDMKLRLIFEDHQGRTRETPEYVLGK